MQAVWTEDHALAWHLEEKFRQNSTVWALDKCLAWDQLEEKLPSFIRELIDCPCTLAQARADTGRFHVSVGKEQAQVRRRKGFYCSYRSGCYLSLSMYGNYTCRLSVVVMSVPIDRFYQPSCETPSGFGPDIIKDTMDVLMFI